jgi:D-alanyl-lipoteichoic acid acyltransferase DltB (MBOAT superfamily)
MSLKFIDTELLARLCRIIERYISRTKALHIEKLRACCFLLYLSIFLSVCLSAKTFNIQAISHEWLVTELLFHLNVPYDKTFLLGPQFYLMTLNLEFDDDGPF